MIWWQALVSLAWRNRKEIVDEVEQLVDPAEPGQPLPFVDLERQRAQERAATSHKVPKS